MATDECVQNTERTCLCVIGSVFDLNTAAALRKDEFMSVSFQLKAPLGVLPWLFPGKGSEAIHEGRSGTVTVTNSCVVLLESIRQKIMTVDDIVLF